MYISQFKEACVTYMSGFVVLKLEPKVKCMQCAKALSASDGSMHSFFLMADRGGLKKPSKSTSALCIEAEKCFERLLNASQGSLPQGEGVPEAIAFAVLQNTSDMNLFPELIEHQFDSAVEENHILQLIKRIVSKYVAIRLYHLGKKLTATVTGQSVRKKLTKTIQFLHQ